MNPNPAAFHPVCSLCKEPRAKMGQGIRERLKAAHAYNYRWCVRCDRASVPVTRNV